ncbi:MAG: hypothetical protein NTV51_28690 [Verrucomicrobia bacterium]|nr:hypothetical protein [Verrucomicrobiota bacterium]
MLLGALAVTGIWLWSLADSLDPWRFVTAVLATVGFIGSGTVFAKKIIRHDHRLSSESLSSSALVLALVPSFVGLQVLAFEAIGRRGGPPQHVDRRYSLLFFGIAVYFAVFPMLTRLLLRQSPSPHLKLHPSDTGDWLKR